MKTLLIAIILFINTQILTAQFDITIELKGNGWNNPTTYLDVIQNGSTIATYTDQGINTLPISCDYPIQLVTNGDILLFDLLDSVIACESVCDRFPAFDCMVGNTCEHVTDCINLPLEWVSFDGKMLNEGVALKWEIASAINVEKFIIERSEIKAIYFQSIGETLFLGNKYTFNDSNSLPAYYRIKQIDFDGAFEYSKVIFVDGKDDTTFTTYNLVTGHLALKNRLDRSQVIGTKNSSSYGLIYLLK